MKPTRRHVVAPLAGTVALLLLWGTVAVGQTVLDIFRGKVRITSTAADSLGVGCTAPAPSSASCTGGIYAGPGVFSSVTSGGVVLSGPPVTGTFATLFDGNLTRLNAIAFVGGLLPVIDATGLLCDTGTSAGASGIFTDLSPTVTLEPSFAFSGSIQLTTKGTLGDIYVGIAHATVGLAASTPNLATNKHFGFKIAWSSSGNGVLSATQSGGSADSTTTLDSGIVVNDHLVFYAEVNTAGNGINYYYWKNGGARSSVTTMTTNYPSGTVDKHLEISISSRNIATNSKMYAMGASVKYGS